MTETDGFFGIVMPDYSVQTCGVPENPAIDELLFCLNFGDEAAGETGDFLDGSQPVICLVFRLVRTDAHTERRYTLYVFSEDFGAQVTGCKGFTGFFRVNLARERTGLYPVLGDRNGFFRRFLTAGFAGVSFAGLSGLTDTAGAG